MQCFISHILKTKILPSQPLLSLFCCILINISFDILFFILNHLKVFSNFLCDFSLSHWLFKSGLFIFCISLNFPVFLLLLISSLIHLWLEKILCTILVFLKKNIYSAVVEYFLLFLEQNSSSPLWFKFLQVRILTSFSGTVSLHSSLGLLRNLFFCFSDLLT